MFSRKQLILAAAAALSLGILGVSVRAWWLARQAVAESSQRASRSSQLAFTFSPVAGNVNSPFTSIAAAADYRTATVFEGDLFVCGKSALYRYSADGKLKQVWNTGRELPAASLITVAVRRGTGTPELWVGTDGEGAVVFDNLQMRQFRPERPEFRKVSALLGLGDGRMLLGTAEHGLLVTDTKQLSFFHPEFARVKVTRLAGTTDALWVGTRKTGVWLWRAGEIQRFESELPDPQVLSLETEGARAWVGTPLGVAEFTDGKFSRKLAEGVFSQALGLLPGTAGSEATGGTLAIGTMDEGVLLADLRVERPRPQRTGSGKAGSASTAVQSFVHTPQALLAVSRRALVRLPDATISLDADRSGEGASLSDGHIAALWADQQGNLWVGYFDRGLDIVRLNGNGPTRHFEDDHIFCVNRIKEDEAGNVVAVATANGLALFDRGQQLRQILDRKSGLIASHATDVLFRRLANGDTSMVVATPAGVSFVGGGSISSIYAFEGLANNHVYTLAWRGGDLFAGTLGGFSLVRNGLVTASFTTANSGLHQNWITASAPDGSDVYLGTYGSGVLKLTAQGSLEQFESAAGASSRVEINPNALWVTASGVYAGTASQGLAILKRGSDRWRFVAAGLPSLNVTAIAGRNGVLYIGTENGFVKVSESALP